MKGVLDLPRNIGSLPTAIVLCSLLLLISGPLAYLGIDTVAVDPDPRIWLEIAIGREAVPYIASISAAAFSLVATSLILWERKGWLNTFVIGMMAVVVTVAFIPMVASALSAVTIAMVGPAGVLGIMAAFGVLIAFFFYCWWWVPVGGVIALLAVTLVSLLFGTPKAK